MYHNALEGISDIENAAVWGQVFSTSAGIAPLPASALVIETGQEVGP